MAIQLPTTIVGILVAIVVITLISIHIFEVVNTYLNSCYIKSTIDGNVYLVRNTPKKQETADTLATLNVNIERLIRSLQHKDHREYQTVVDRLSGYKHTSLSENILQKDTSFTVNKKDINVCLTTRNRDNNIYDINLLMFVLIHELAHYCSASIGHNKEFIDNFKFLLKKAIDAGVYRYEDYSQSNKEYCGIKIKNNIL